MTRLQTRLLPTLIFLTATACGTDRDHAPESSAMATNDADATTNGDDPSTGRLSSVEAFAQSLYPILQNNCQTCHAKTITPFFAADDISIAHDALMASKKVNLENVATSRLLTRLSVDKHNCWSGDCEADAKVISEAITAWKDAMAEPSSDADDGLKLSASLSLEQTIKRTVGLGPGTIVLEAEAGTIRAPMRIQADPNASGGNFVFAPNNNNNTLPAGAANAGSLEFAVNVQIPGTYKIWARVMAPNQNDRSFHVSVDGAASTPWIIPISNAWSWDAVSADNGARDLTFNFAAGRHTIRFSQRQDGTRIDQIVITDDTSFDGSNFNKTIELLRFDLSKLMPNNPAILELEVSAFDANSYKVGNPTLVMSRRPVKIKGLHILLNGQLDPQHATYSQLDLTVPAPGGVLSSAALIMLRDKNKSPQEDRLQVGFKLLE